MLSVFALSLIYVLAHRDNLVTANNICLYPLQSKTIERKKCILTNVWKVSICAGYYPDSVHRSPT